MAYLVWGSPRWLSSSVDADHAWIAASWGIAIEVVLKHMKVQPSTACHCEMAFSRRCNCGSVEDTDRECVHGQRREEAETESDLATTIRMLYRNVCVHGGIAIDVAEYLPILVSSCAVLSNSVSFPKCSHL